MKQTLIAHATRAATLCLALFAVGCSSFNSEWRQAASRKPSRDLSGRWEGRWISEKNGHTGALRAVITPVYSRSNIDTFLKRCAATAHVYASSDIDTLLKGDAKSSITMKADGFHALFHATYASVLTFTYPANFTAKKRGGHYEFRGETDLPAWAGGRYSYDGRVEGDTFTATYKSKYDDGRFEMKRVPSQYMNCQSILER